MRRRLLPLLLLAACGEDPPPPPPDPALVVVAEDGQELRGEAWVRTSKVQPLLLTIDLQAAPAPEEGAPEPEVTWSFRARVPTSKALSNDLGTLTWPAGEQVVYHSEHGAGDAGTATVTLGGGRISGTIASTGGKEATFEAGINIECLVDYKDVTNPPPDAHTDEQVNDTLFETEWCRALKGLR